MRLALEGRVAQAITTLRNEQKVSVHRVRLAVSALLILAALATVFTGGRVGFANVGSAAILLIITLLFFVQLAQKSRRVARLLNPETEPKELPANSSATSLPEASTNALNTTINKAPVSVTERTTVKLNPDD